MRLRLALQRWKNLKASSSHRVGWVFPTLPILQREDGRFLTMGQADSTGQLGFFPQETATARHAKGAGISIYKVSLVREGRLPYYEQRIRSSAMASTILHTYLADVDR